MKRRHFISFVFVLILCIGMIGCGKEKKTTASDKFQSDYMEIGVGTTVEKGYFGVINGLLYYVDFETMNAVPICNKPDCRHISWMEDRNTKCNAANTDIWNLFPYKGKLYGFRSLADGGSELVVSDLDGSNWKSKGMFIKAEESFHEGVVVKGFYYIGDEGKSLYCYHIDSKENEKIVQAEEVGAEKVTVEGVSEEGILFRAFPENELYVKNEEGISNLKLSDRLPTDQAWLSGINDITKDGVYFTYQEKYIGEKEIEGDLLMYDAYIEKEDLFGKTGEMKVIYTPRVSSAGNIVTEE